MGGWLVAFVLPFRPRLPLDTQRLTLRSFVPGDYDALMAYHSNPDVVRYVPFGPRSPEGMSKALASKIAGVILAAEGDHLDVAVVLGDVLIGDLVVMLRSVEHQTVEVGWMMNPACSGRGYATEAVAALLDLVFADLRAHRMVARVDARNADSLALCERLGMRREAHLVDNEWFKGEWSSETDYALLGRDWPRRPSDSGPSS